MNDNTPDRVVDENDVEEVVNTTNGKDDDADMSNDQEQISTNDDDKENEEKHPQSNDVAQSDNDFDMNNNQEQTNMNDDEEANSTEGQEGEGVEQDWLIATPNVTDGADSFPSAPKYIDPWLVRLIENDQPLTMAEFMLANAPAHGPADDCVLCQSPMRPMLITIKPDPQQPWSIPDDMPVGHMLCPHRLHWGCLCDLMDHVQDGTPPRCPSCRVWFFHTALQREWATFVESLMNYLGYYPGNMHFPCPKGEEVIRLKKDYVRSSLKVYIRIAAYSVAHGRVMDSTMGRIVKTAACSKEGRNMVAGMIRALDDKSMKRTWRDMDDLTSELVANAQNEMVMSNHVDSDEDVSAAASEFGEEVANRAVQLYLDYRLMNEEPGVSPIEV